jgi:hypothetical protein
MMKRKAHKIESITVEMGDLAYRQCTEVMNRTIEVMNMTKECMLMLEKLGARPDGEDVLLKENVTP